MKWIGLTGKMGAGKDFAYDRLSTMFPEKVLRCSFADTLRIEIRDTLGMDSVITKPYTELERKLQQWWGTDYRRQENEDYWVERTRERALVMYGETGRVPVFTDVRFPNEADMIRDHDGAIARIWAPISIRRNRLGMEPPEHESETAMDDYEVDVMVRSDGDHGKYLQNLLQLAYLAGLTG